MITLKPTRQRRFTCHLPLNELLLTLALAVAMGGCQGQSAPTRQSLASQFPSVEQGSTRPENKKILCPFQRMLERSGIYDAEVAGKDTLTVAAGSVTAASQVFGCSTSSCGSVANSVATQQGGDGIDLERLHQAGTIAHECGLTFDHYGTEVSDTVRDATLARLLELADVEGRLSYQNLVTVQREICASQGEPVSSPGRTEIRLIYAYLGGVERGYILHSDVSRLLHATLPVTTTSSWINASLLSQVR